MGVTDLFSSAELHIEQPNAQLYYELADAAGNVLARATQVGGVRKSAFQRFFSSSDKSRVVLQVADTAGVPLFVLDRAEVVPGAGARQPPCAVVAPDGTLIGRVEHDVQAMHRSAPEVTYAYRLVDAAGRVLCDVVREPVRIGMTVDNETGGRYAVYTDTNGVEIAHLETGNTKVLADRSTLRLLYQLPDPLRTLVVAYPIAWDLMHSALYGN